MKRNLFAVLIAILVLASCVSASAAEYTHPTAGFRLTVPEGWLAVDSANADEIAGSGRMSAAMAVSVASIRGILDSTLSVYLFDLTQSPLACVSVEYKGEQEAEITPEDILATAQAYEAYYLKDSGQFPGYTVSLPAGAELVEDWYPMGYLGGVYEYSGSRMARTQIFVAAGTRFYEFTLAAAEDQSANVLPAFYELVGSFAASTGAPEKSPDLSGLLPSPEMDAAAPSERLAYRNEPYGLYFTMPEGWSAVPDENQTVFEGPAESDSILLVSLTDRKVDAAFAASFDVATAEKWMRESRLFSEFTFTECTPLMFAGAMDGNGRLYAIHMCRFGAEEFPPDYASFYAQLFFTDENGVLGDVSLLTPATQQNPLLAWFDAMTKGNIPHDAYAEIAAQLSSR